MASAVTNTLVPPRRMRSASGSGPYPEKAGATMAPIRAAASMVTIASGMTGRCMVTTSPRPTPSRRSPPAAAATSRSSAA